MEIANTINSAILTGSDNADNRIKFLLTHTAATIQLVTKVRKSALTRAQATTLSALQVRRMLVTIMLFLQATAII